MTVTAPELENTVGLIMTPLRLRNAVTPGDVVEIEGKVDTGATMLVLPGSVATELNLPVIRRQIVKDANERTEEKDVVWGVELEICGRRGVFSAIVEPTKTYALVGAVVMEELDLIAEPQARRVLPNPRSHLPTAEIE
jgi:predicted aspartyl protease